MKRILTTTHLLGLSAWAVVAVAFWTTVFPTTPVLAPVYETTIVPAVSYQHERTVPPSFGELDSPCYVRWSAGC
jgi:hypothetical protein